MATKLEKLKEAKAGATQRGVKTELEVRERRLKGHPSPPLSRGQATAYRYSMSQAEKPGASVEAKRAAAEGKARLREHLGRDIFDE